MCISINLYVNQAKVMCGHLSFPDLSGILSSNSTTCYTSNNIQCFVVVAMTIVSRSVTPPRLPCSSPPCSTLPCSILRCLLSLQLHTFSRVSRQTWLATVWSSSLSVSKRLNKISKVSPAGSLSVSPAASHNKDPNCKIEHHTCTVLCYVTFNHNKCG